MKTNSHTLEGPIKCWDIYSMYLAEQAINFNRQTEIEMLKQFKKTFNWTFDIETVLTDHVYEALILTNFTQEIQWVNKRFTKMTGYSTKFAKGKNPNFLQGKNTSPQALNNIRGYLKKGIHFKETIDNYRKNGEIYHCNIEVYPLKDANKIITHFLALEHEIRL